MILVAVLSAAIGFLSALAFGVLQWRTPLRNALTDTQAALRVEVDRRTAAEIAHGEARRSARLLRPPVQAEIMQWARPRCSKCRGQGFNDKGFCDCIVRSALYKKAVEEGRVVEIRKPYQRRPVPWVAELTELPEN